MVKNKLRIDVGDIGGKTCNGKTLWGPQLVWFDVAVMARGTTSSILAHTPLHLVPLQRAVDW